MATNMIYKYDPKKTRERPVPAGTVSGAPLLIETRPAVTLTARGDVTKTIPGIAGGITSITYKIGGAGNEPDSASVAFDGTWEFPVVGATTSTANGVQVYITAANALTLTASGNTAYGFTDYPKSYFKVAGIAAVRIGA